MERRIRVKCPECAASLQLLVEQQELLDVSCPRCQHAFTTKVPPLVEVEAVEVVEEEEPPPPVRQTRIVQPAPARQTKPVRQTPRNTPTSATRADQSWPADPLSNTSWQTPTYQVNSAPRVSGATHLKAFLIATGSVIGVVVLVMLGFMLKSAISSIEWPSFGDSTESATASTTTADSSSKPTGASSSSGPTDAELAQKMIQGARRLGEATKSWDNETVLANTSPRLIKAVGGERKMREVLNTAVNQFRAQGVTVAAYTVHENVTLRRVGRKVFGIVPTAMDLAVSGRLLRSDNFLIAISEDSGRTFTYLDGAAATKEPAAFKKLLPDLPSDLVLPPRNEPRDITP